LKFFYDKIQFIQILKKKDYLTNFIDNNLLKICLNTINLAILSLFINDFLTILFWFPFLSLSEDCYKLKIVIKNAEKLQLAYGQFIIKELQNALSCCFHKINRKIQKIWNFLFKELVVNSLSKL